MNNYGRTGHYVLPDRNQKVLKINTRYTFKKKINLWGGTIIFKNAF